VQERETYLGESGHTWWCGAVGREREEARKGMQMGMPGLRGMRLIRSMRESWPWKSQMILLRFFNQIYLTVFLILILLVGSMGF
jgi:hypothetical protein